jgi:hypothetical protein
VSVTFTVKGVCQSMTWHAKAMVTSYMARAGSGCDGHPAGAGDEFFQFSCTSWFFLSGVDAWGEGSERVVAVLGDSITDGTNSTINGCDRWPDMLGRCVNERALRLQRPFTYVINCGIGGNCISHPLSHDQDSPNRGGIAAAVRMSEEVLRLQGLTCCIWSQGINDFRTVSASAVIAVVANTIAAARAVAPHVTFVGCTVASALDSPCAGHGGGTQDTERRAFNEWMRSGVAPFDKIVDFDKVLTLPTLLSCGASRTSHTDFAAAYLPRHRQAEA